ncbi:condensation domain-containing protein [Salinifilum aidingensis]
MLTALSDHPVPPGRLVEFRVRPAASGAAPADDRPPSYLQETHLRAEEALLRADRWSPTWLAIAFDAPEAVELDHLRGAFAAWVRRHEGLRTGLVRTGGRLRRFTYASEQLAVRSAVLGDFTSGAEVRARLEELFDEGTDVLARWPAYVFAAVLHEGTATVFTAFDHSATDGYSNGLVPHEIRELLLAERDDRPVGLPATGSHVDYSAVERSAASDVDSAHPAAGVWRKFLDGAGEGNAAFPFDPELAPGQVVPSTAHREELLGAAEAAEFEEVCAGSGGRFHTGVMAACALAASETGGTREFRATLPMHTRRRNEWVSSFGWYVNVLPFHLGVRDGASFAEVNADAAAVIRGAIPALRVPSGRVAELLGELPEAPFNVSYMDFRGVPGIEGWSEWNACNLGKFVQADGWHAGLWFHRTCDGLSVTAAHADTGGARGTARAFLAQLRRVVRAVAETGAHRPVPAPARA